MFRALGQLAESPDSDPVQPQSDTGSPVMVVTKWRIPGAVCDPDHSHGETVAPQWPHQRRMVRRGLTGEDHAQDHKHNSEVREVREPKDQLTEQDLNKVSGGGIYINWNDPSLKSTDGWHDWIQVRSA
jgi:hypothetical protein